MLMKLIILTLADRPFTDSIALSHLRSVSDMTGEQITRCCWVPCLYAGQLLLVCSALNSFYTLRIVHYLTSQGHSEWTKSICTPERGLVSHCSYNNELFMRSCHYVIERWLLTGCIVSILAVLGYLNGEHKEEKTNVALPFKRLGLVSVYIYNFLFKELNTKCFNLRISFQQKCFQPW